MGTYKGEVMLRAETILCIMSTSIPSFISAKKLERKDKLKTKAQRTDELSDDDTMMHLKMKD